MYEASRVTSRVLPSAYRAITAICWDKAGFGIKISAGTTSRSFTWAALASPKGTPSESHSRIVL